jgi:DNA excision repair protein ERCC-1
VLLSLFCVLNRSSCSYSQHIVRRIEDVGNMYKIRILLILVDDENNLTVMQELNRLAFIYNYTLIFTWSNLECARYLETFKNYENKSSASIQSKEETEFVPKLHKLLSNNIKSVNKTDVVTLLDTFTNLSGILAAKEENFILCPGIGEKKAKRLYSVFHEPFIKDNLYIAGKKGGMAGGSKSNFVINSESVYLEQEQQQQQQQNTAERENPAFEQFGEIQERSEKLAKDVVVELEEDLLPNDDGGSDNDKNDKNGDDEPEQKKRKIFHFHQQLEVTEKKKIDLIDLDSPEK